MDRFSRGFLRFGLVALLGATLSSCSNGGGGGRVLRLFFGINGEGSCNSVVVDVDLQAAGAVLALKDDQSLDCALNTVLAGNGCNVDFAEVDGGDTLRVTVNGCTIPPVTNLFQCGFTDADISQLEAVTSAQCACKNPGCDATPPVCIGEDPDPTACEDCSNGKDDDGNGLIDCEDPNCRHSPACAATTTTTIPSTTTSSTTTTTSSTTTTIPSGKTDCTIVFRLASDVTAGSLQWDTNYAKTSGELVGSGASVECSSLASGSLAAFSDNDAAHTLSSGFVNLSGIDGPTDVASCHYQGPGRPTAGEFLIDVTDATDPDLNDIVPTPDVVVTSIDCIDVTTTTLPGETTTTLGGGTTTTLGGETTTTVEGPTTTTLPPEHDTILFKLNSSGSPLGALQFSVNYTNAPGGFDGAGASVVCTNEVTGALFAPNDNEAQHKLTLGLIALSAFSAPTDLVSCQFTRDGATAPVPGNFAVTVDDSTDIDGNTVAAAIGVVVNP